MPETHLCVCRGSRAAYVYVIRQLCEFVCHAIRYVGPGRGATVSAQNDPVLVASRHDRGLRESM